MSGPTSVDMSVGSPTFIDATAAVIASTASS
jgi:hypothetical protein